MFDVVLDTWTALLQLTRD